MAATQVSFQDESNASISQNPDAIRLVQIGNDDAVLVGVGADYFGNDGGSVYEMSYTEQIEYQNMGSGQQKRNVAGKPVASALQQGDQKLMLSLIGYTERAIGTKWYSLEALVKSRKRWKAAFYDQVDEAVYVKRVFWNVIIIPTLQLIRRDGEFSIIPCEILCQSSRFAAVDPILGTVGKYMRVSTVQTYTSETFESQAEIVLS